MFAFKRTHYNKKVEYRTWTNIEPKCAKSAQELVLKSRSGCGEDDQIHSVRYETEWREETNGRGKLVRMVEIQRQVVTEVTGEDDEVGQLTSAPISDESMSCLFFF